VGFVILGPRNPPSIVAGHDCPGGFFIARGRISRMKFQFGTKTILLVTAIVAIACGGMLGWEQIVGLPAANRGLIWTVEIIPFAAPIWIPIAFVAFAIGRKALTVRMVVALAITQSVGVGVAYLIQKYA
jgi:hypothetical protein